MSSMKIIDELQYYSYQYPRDKILSEKFIDFICSDNSCYSRENLKRHITGSAWITDSDNSQVLLTLHKKLNKWIVPGGHSEEETCPFDTAVREAEEETGLKLTPQGREILSLDIHEIPAYNKIPEHSHWDFTYAFKAMGCRKYTVSSESHDLKWVPLNKLEDFTQEENIIKLRDRWLHKVSGS